MRFFPPFELWALDKTWRSFNAIISGLYILNVKTIEKWKPLNSLRLNAGNIETTVSHQKRNKSFRIGMLLRALLQTGQLGDFESWSSNATVVI